jgi:hypothetical protein
MILRFACVPAVLGIVAASVILTSARKESSPQVVAASLSPQARVISVAAPILSLKPRPADDLSAFQEDYDPDQARITWARRILESPEEALQADSDVLRFGPMRVPRDIAATIVRAASVTQMDASLLMAIADKESSFAPKVKASTSSATGLYQFIESTWLRVMRDFGASYGYAREAQLIQGPDERPSIEDPAERRKVLDLRNDAYLSAVLAAEMLKKDAARIEASVGRPLSQGEIYLAHFLGPSDAERFIAKLIAAPAYAAQKLLPRPARANRPIFYHGRGRKAKSLSVADVHEKFEQMMGTRSDRYRNVTRLTGAGGVNGVTAYADPQ